MGFLDSILRSLTFSKDLVQHLKSSMAMLPDEQTKLLVDIYGLSMKDAKTMVALDGGLRLDYFMEVMGVMKALGSAASTHRDGRTVSNWYVEPPGHAT